eukprot:3998789-Amphidinium_carterae.1
MSLHTQPLGASQRQQRKQGKQQQQQQQQQRSSNVRPPAPNSKQSAKEQHGELKEGATGKVAKPVLSLCAEEWSAPTNHEFRSLED